jgi:hypothetical protein
MDHMSSVPPKPSEDATKAFIAELNAIDPDIVHGKPDKAIDRARDQCTSIRAWHDAEPKLVEVRLIELTRQRFTSPAHPDGFGSEMAARILAAVRTYICG